MRKCGCLAFLKSELKRKRLARDGLLDKKISSRRKPAALFSFNYKESIYCKIPRNTIQLSLFISSE